MRLELLHFFAILATGAFGGVAAEAAAEIAPASTGEIVDNALIPPTPSPTPSDIEIAIATATMPPGRPDINRTAFVMPTRPNYPAEEEAALAALRPLVEHEFLHLVEPWMDNHFRETSMLKFLRARNLNVQSTAAMIRTAIAWRNATDLHRLLATDYSKWERLFPFIISGVDKEQRPLFYIFISAYDIRKAVIAGHFQTLVHLYDRSFELGFRKAIQSYTTTGQNQALQGLMIIDCSGFNLRQHACLGCLPIYVHVIQSFENYYPQTLHKVLLVNAPPAIEVVLRVIRPFMSPYTRKALEVYGVDKREWLPVLAKYIERDQLLERFGGSRRLDAPGSLKLG